MGGGIFKCCQPDREFLEIDSDGEEDPYARDIIIMRNMMNFAPTIYLGVTVSYPDGRVRAVVPDEWKIDPICVKDLIDAFKGKNAGLADRFINLGPGLPKYVPGKMIDGSVLYCVGVTDKPEGCIILKTRSCLLIVCYSGDSEMSARVAEDTAHKMIDCDL